MIDFVSKSTYNVDDFRHIIRILRSPDGCPWDREQTHESIRRNLLEEAYEAAEAIDEGDATHLCEELGDVLMQVLFHSDIEEEAGRFTIDDVADMAVKKLIGRHPHVFGDRAVSGSEEVLANWDELKRLERRQETVTETLRAVAKSLPALWRAEKLQKKAAKVGFDFTDAAGAMDKLEEELSELRAAESAEDREEELGDLLFSAVNLARFCHVDPEAALHRACEKFTARFAQVEAAAAAAGKELEAMTLSEMDMLWEDAKTALE